MIKLKDILLSESPARVNGKWGYINTVTKRHTDDNDWSPKDVPLKEDDDFGDWVFTDYDFNGMTAPDFVKYQHGDHEKNTDLETTVYSLLKTWVVNPSNNTSDLLLKHESEFQKAKLMHPLIFKPSRQNGTYVYRGLRKLNRRLYQFTTNTKLEDWKHTTVNGVAIVVYKFPINYEPRKSIQSWSYNVTKAADFSQEAFGGDDNNVFRCTLRTKQDDNFIFNYRVFKIIYTFDEKEVLHFGMRYTQPVELIMPEESLGRLEIIQNNRKNNAK